jgi:creatinine amidohydrolase
MLKHRLRDMSWMEAQEAFKRSDTVLMPVGTLHGHGPTPIGIDGTSVERLADEVGKRTGLLTLPLLPYGENDKMKLYPGSIAIGPAVLEAFYTDICRSLHRNGIRKVIFLNGHGGNKEPLIRTGRTVREWGMLVAIVEWWSIGRKLWPDLWPEARGSYMAELSVAVAISGTSVPDLRADRYKGEWGTDRALRKVFGERIRPLGFNDFEYEGAQIVIPVDGWDLDIESPPGVDENTLEALRLRGEETIQRLAEYMSGFAVEFQRIDVFQALQHS